MPGIGYGQVMATAAVTSYYVSLMALSLFYLVASFQVTFLQYIPYLLICDLFSRTIETYKTCPKLHLRRIYPGPAVTLPGSATRRAWRCLATRWRHTISVVPTLPHQTTWRGAVPSYFSSERNAPLPIRMYKNAEHTDIRSATETQ